MMDKRESSLLHRIDPYRQASQAMYSIEGFGIVSSQATRILNDLSDAFREGVADAVSRLHQHYYKKEKMPANLFEIMRDVYGEKGWF